MNEDELNFSSPRDLAKMLETVGMILHAKNRMGAETKFLWHLAETIRKAGQLSYKIEDEDMLAEYGDGYQSGSIPKEMQEEAFLKLLAKQRNET